MIRPFRLFATLAATLALALGVTVRLVRAAPDAAPAVAYQGAVPVHARAEESGGEYRLDRLPILSRVILSVKDNYVDPSRIDPKKMVVAALDSVEKTVAEVLVNGDAKSPRLTLTVGENTRELDISGVDSIWKVRTVLGEAMGFIQQHLVAHKDLKEIEYAAVNGMLSTLDPHTVLLEPKYFKEMKLQTRGEFGGLGFVIAMRDGNLTVVRVLKGTPAQRAGVKAKDLIQKIEEQSTINMDLQDAVDRLRGKPQTKVSITIHRAGWPEAKRLNLIREVIQVETVPQAQLLEGGVGYVKLSQFSANTTRDLSQAIQREASEAGGKLTGLVLDLRGNPGGLLEQAIQVSDLFLSEGVIVKTVGGGDKQRINEVKEATADSTDITGLPLVLIVNNSSASASEIVAGALKNNGRALVIGRQTFGKGSVQVLHDFAEPGKQGEEAALKLTIAQYLTPGDISIQEVGITPDVLLLPGRALKEQVNFFAPPRSVGEADLDAHFSNPGGGPAPGAPSAAAAAAAEKEKEKKKRVEKAPLELRYLLEEKEDEVAKAIKRDARESAATAPAGASTGHPATGTELTPEQQEDEAAEADPDRFVEDYQIRFARELIKRAPFPDRARLLEGAKGFVAERRVDEEQRLGRRLTDLGVDWSDGKVTGAPRAAVTIAPPVGKDLRAGDTAQWTVTVENRGDAPFKRLRAWTLAEKNPLLDRREFVFGTIRPGERKSWAVPVKIPKGTDSRRDQVTFHFDDDSGKAPSDVATSFGVVEVAKPAFAFSVQLEDRAGGNGDGLAQRGETFTVRVDVKNVGDGPSGDKTYVTLKNLGDDKIFIKKGRDVLGAIKPGESKSASMEVELRRGSKSEELPFRLQIIDEKMDEFLAEKIDWPISNDERAPVPSKTSVRIEANEALLRTGAAPSAWPLATAKKGAILPADARVGDFWRVEWTKGRFAFVADADVKPAKGPRAGTIVEAWQREPPRVALTPDPAKGAPVVDGDTYKLSGSAMVSPNADGSAKLRDVFVFVNEQKVFFRVVPQSASAQKLDFQADLPLKVGNNVVTVFAREDEDLQTRRSVVIYRRPPAEMAQDAAQTKRAGQ
jgi:carboxyl-terminal processing protease